jgi:pimeloyl-ACP methyl ester carboxylesterase
MKVKLATLFFTVVCSIAFGQTFEKIVFNDKKADHYYILLRPNTDEIKGVLILLPGYGENPESIFPESKLFNVAYANGILTVAIAGGQKLYADESVVDKLDRALNHLLEKNRALNKTKFIIGGFSAGGTIALRYAESCWQSPEKYPIKPNGVFTVDSPVDLFDIWDYFQREIEKNFSEVGVNEAKFVTQIMTKELGTPFTNENRYNELTPFKRKLKELGNEKYLKTVAVRVYHDTDIEWQLRERRRSFYDTNQLAASELVSRLLLNGNNKAEFMTSKTRGYRSGGLRHPHSWSIVDEVELVQWALKIFDSKDM